MLITCEQVSGGHPDKICDQISDAIVTDCLKYDRHSRVAVETLIKDNHVTVAGEITSTHTPDVRELVAWVLRKQIPELGDFYLTVQLTRQSPDIALGVDRDGAGDQGVVYGYATAETDEMLPLPFVLATAAIQKLESLDDPLLGKDAKCQVTYDDEQRRIDTFLISTQHKADADLEAVREIAQQVMMEVAADYGMNTDFRVLVNPTGRFVLGGPFADTGVTGRKIIADTYGGICRHGGGAFSGKDPTKVDRSGAYMARKIAKDIVHQNLADRCEVQLAYAIGVAQPVSVAVDCFGTEKIPAVDIVDWIRNTYDLTPKGIINGLGLLDVDYNTAATLGHFWHSEMPWEQ